MTETVIPTSPADIQKIQNAVIEASNSKLRIEAERDLIKDIAQRIQDEVGIAKRDFNKMVKVYFKNEFKKVQEDLNEFADLYSKVMAGKDVNVE